MLNLQSATSERWLRQVDEHLDQILIDHAHCEKKAAGTAMNLIFAYVENQDLCRAMSEIVNEELAHFHLVLDLLRKHMQDRELADFFGGLFESEARHHSTYVRLAKMYASLDSHEPDFA